MRILVIEHPAVAGFVVQGLRDHGHIVDVTSDADSGLRLGRSGAYAVIVLAALLPKGDGVQLGAALRRSGQSVPILLLTPDDHDAEHFVRQAGADGYLVKPFRFDVLLEYVRVLSTRPSPRVDP